MNSKQEWSATGRRKRSSAQVRMTMGKGNITVNGVDVNEYMPYPTLIMDLKQPLVATNNENNFDITVTVKGGGFSGQTGAIRLAITRELMEYDTAILDCSKAIEINPESKNLVVPTRNYVVLKRFTSKEQKKRVHAAVLNANKFSDFF